MTALDPKKLIFIDESGANLRMANRYARAVGGQRAKMPIPCNRGPNISIIGAVSMRKVEAALYGEWATNSEIFLIFIDRCLSPQLRPGHIVIMDNVRFHYQSKIVEIIESKGASVVFLPPYSPDFSPIENMWSKIKNYLRGFMPRTMQEFKKSIKSAFESISESNLIGWFKHCGYNVQTR